MPALIALLVNMLRVMLMAKVGVFIAKILLFFGLSLAVDTYAVDPLIAQIQGLITTSPGGGLGATLIGWAGVLKFDVALSMYLSAFSTAATIRATKVYLGLNPEV